MEDGYVPRDAKVVDKTWLYVNKDGGPDRRFSNNRQMPVALYGALLMDSGPGFRLELQTSSAAMAEGAAKLLELIGDAAKRVRNIRAGCQGDDALPPDDVFSEVPTPPLARVARAFESKKVAIGVLSGVLGIAVLLALILMIVGKGNEPAARPQPVVAQQSKPVPPKPAPVEVQPQALLAERSLTEPRAVSTAVSTKQDPGKAGTSTADAQVPAESTPTLVQPESLLGSATPAKKVPASITSTKPNPRPEEHPTDPHQAFLNQLAHMNDPMSEEEHTQALKELTRINPRLVRDPGAPPKRGTYGACQHPDNQVIRVIDGDTIVVQVNGHPETVGLIGVDTPETKDPRKPVEYFGKEASRFTASLVKGQRVRLEIQTSPTSRDKYGRLLAYVFRQSDNLLLNKEIIRQGYGHAYTKYYFDPGRMDEFRAAERSAREQKRGLWASVDPR